MKGAAYTGDRRDRERHLQDAAVLAACITDLRANSSVLLPEPFRVRLGDSHECLHDDGAVDVRRDAVCDLLGDLAGRRISQRPAGRDSSPSIPTGSPW